MSALNVFWNTDLIGRLSKSGGQDMSFQYASSYLASPQSQAISLSLPLQEEAFSGSVSQSWFANLLPEGEIRGNVAQKLGISQRNEFAMLKAIGGDCAGALRLLPESVSNVSEGKLIPLPWDELESKIASSSRPSLLALVLQDGEIRLSLAGAQDKLPVHIANGRLALPSGNAASTHLLKISNGNFPGLVQNELFCLTLAHKVGLSVPHAEMANTETPILLVERYDRFTDAENVVHRLHQEDFCQALGSPPELKYENEGGPSLEMIFGALERGSQAPLPDKRELLKWVFFNFIIGNADAHVKNVSFLYGKKSDETGPRLAPFYDLVCTEVYDQLAKKQAQKIGGENRPRDVALRHWERFAALIEVNPKYLRTAGLKMCDDVEKMAGEGNGLEVLEQIREVIAKRVRWVRMQLG